MSEQPSLIPVSTGSELRDLRQARGLSLARAAERIRCPQGVLEAIEQDCAPDIAPIYLRGHLKRYAELLELDAASTTTLLDAFQGETPGVQSVFEVRPPAQASDRWLRVASYVLASLLVGTLAWQMAHEAVRLARVDGPEVAAPSPDGAGEGTPSSAHVNASIAGLEVLNSPGGSRTADAGESAWAALDEARRRASMLAEGEHLIELQTSADTWVEISGADGKLLEQDLLRGGESRTYRGAGPFRVSLGRSSAVRLALDGRPVDLAPHTREDVARLLLDPAVYAGETSASPGAEAAEPAPGGEGR